MLRGVDMQLRPIVALENGYRFDFTDGLDVNLSGLGWAGFKKMDPRPTVLL